MEIEDQNLVQHNQTDEALQKRQNALIEKNTRITILLGGLAILAQLLDTLINLFT